MPASDAEDHVWDGGGGPTWSLDFFAFFGLLGTQAKVIAPPIIASNMPMKNPPRSDDMNDAAARTTIRIPAIWRWLGANHTSSPKAEMRTPTRMPTHTI